MVSSRHQNKSNLSNLYYFLVPTGRYYIQNGADGSVSCNWQAFDNIYVMYTCCTNIFQVLTVETKNNTPIIRTHQFKPYISKGQQFQVEKVMWDIYEELWVD